MQPTYLHKSGPKTRACFTNSRLKNKKFTASRTEIDSITYHDQTFNHDITHKIIKFTSSGKKMTPKTHYAKLWGGGEGGLMMKWTSSSIGACWSSLLQSLHVLFSRLILGLMCLPP